LVLFHFCFAYWKCYAIPAIKIQGRKASAHMLVGMKDVTPTKTRGMAARSF